MSLLHFVPTNDKELLNDLSNDIFGDKCPVSVGYVLFLGEKALGLAILNIKEDNATIQKIGIIKKERNNGYGDFFTRSLLFNLSNVTKNIKIAYKSDYFYKFGFKDEDNYMTINVNDLIFPRKCQEDKK